jgi:hypothetical protein
MTLILRPGYDDGVVFTPGRLVLRRDYAPLFPGDPVNGQEWVDVNTNILWKYNSLIDSWGVLYDPDAAAYIAAVEAADQQSLEDSVKYTIDQFVRGCKADGIWNAIKASCILAGARTLAGALVPLAGTAPTSFNFVDGDYNRKTGLVGDGSTKYLDSNRNNNADPQNSKHVSLYYAQFRTLGFALVGTEDGAISGSTQVADLSGGLISARLNSSGSTGGISRSLGFMGFSRSNSSQIVARIGQVNTTQSIASQGPSNRNIDIYRRGSNPSGSYVDGRLAFYSIGESLDLALLDARVTDLINAFGAAIP